MLFWVFTARSAVDFIRWKTETIRKHSESSALRYPKEHALFYGSEPSPGCFSYDLLTYLLTPCSTVLLEKLTCSQLVKKFPAFYGTRMFITAFTRTRHLSILIDLVHTLTSHFLKIHLNIILQSKIISHIWLFFYSSVITTMHGPINIRFTVFLLFS